MNVHINNLKSYYMKRSDNERDYLDKMTYIIDDSEEQINFNTSEPKKKLQYKYYLGSSCETNMTDIISY